MKVKIDKNTSVKVVEKILEERSHYGISDVLDLSNMDLSGIELSCLTVNNVNFGYSNMSNAVLDNVSIKTCVFVSTILKDCEICSSTISNSNFKHADLSNSRILDSNLTFSEFISANFTDATIKNTTMHKSVMCKANLYGTNLDDTGYHLGYETMDMKVDIRIASQLLYHLCRLNVLDSPGWEEIRNNDSVINYANRSHYVIKKGYPPIVKEKKWIKEQEK